MCGGGDSPLAAARSHLRNTTRAALSEGRCSIHRAPDNLSRTAGAASCPGKVQSAVGWRGQSTGASA